MVLVTNLKNNLRESTYTEILIQGDSGFTTQMYVQK